jgi:AAA+ ATPase superfamily predicted ATPase
MDKVVPRFETRMPVRGESFLDREELLTKLGHLAAAGLRGEPSWVVILGPRKVGKTSVLREVEERTMRSGATDGLVLSIDLFQLDIRPQDVFTALVVRLLAAACRKVGRVDLAGTLLARPTRPAADLTHAISTALPLGCAREAFTTLEALRSPNVRSPVIQRALDLPQHFAEDMGPVWVIFDEIQEIDGLNRQQPFSKQHTVYRLMRSVWQNHTDVSYWATGSQVSLLTRLFTSRRSPFFGHFQLHRIGAFDHAAARELLLRGLSPAADAAEAADLAIRSLGRHPFYVQVLGEEMKLRGLPLSIKSVKAVLQEILLSPSGRLALHVQGILNEDAGSGQQRAVLRTLARGEAGLSQIAAAIPSLTRDVVNSLLRRLEAADLVEREPATHRYHVADPAVAAYLRVGGLDAEPSPAVLGDEGEQAAARHLLSQGLRPVYQSYRSLGPADLVCLEPGRRLAIQVRRTRLPIYIERVEHKRLEAWATEQEMTPLLCQVDPDEPETVRYWRWGEGRRAGKRLRFDLASSSVTALELLVRG